MENEVGLKGIIWIRKMVKFALMVEDCIYEDKAKRRDCGNTLSDTRQL